MINKRLINDLNTDKISPYRPVPFWSWNDKLNKEELVEQIRWMHSQGFGGFVIHARAGLITEYLGDEWFEYVSACIDEGKKLGMQCWAYDENGWPSGFVGGKLLKDPENRNRYLTCSVGKPDKNAAANYLVCGDALVRQKNTECEKTEKNGEYINVYENVSPSTVDILDPAVTEKFINETHAKYKRELGGLFRGLNAFFTDEPQYYSSATPFSAMLIDYFRNEYNEDVYDNLGLLFVDKRGYKEFRYKYYKALQTLMLNNFSRKVYDYCEKNNVALTGHYVEETSVGSQMKYCGGIMPFYMYETIPGIDHLSVRTPKNLSSRQVVSVAAQTGKKRIITESFAGCGWGVTPSGLKRVAEAQYVNGVNMLCQHLLPYSERGQRKRDYPAHYSWVNPWVKANYKGFNDYFAKLGYLIGESEEVVKVALFCPTRSVYFDYKFTETDDFIGKADKSYSELAEKLAALNVPFHILDENVIAELACVKGNSLIVGKCVYEYVIFPEVYTMDRFTYGIFAQYCENGGKILFASGLPKYLEWKEFVYPFRSTCDLGEIVASNKIKVTVTGSTGLRTSLRTINGQDFMFAVNPSETDAVTAEFEGDFLSFDCLDLETLKTSKIPKTLCFEPGMSRVLFPSDEPVGFSETEEYTVLDGEFEVVDASENYLLLDKPQYSLDGENYSEPLRYIGVFNELINRRYCGEAYLRYTFKAENVPKKIAFLSEDTNVLSCSVNGNLVTFDGHSDFEKRILKANILPFVKKGENIIDVKIRFSQRKEVYYALFGEGVTEGVKNCLTYDTTIEPCYLQGDFGVYSEKGFSEEKDNIRVANDFYLGERQRFVKDTIKDGYPFFAGEMVLRKNFSVLNKNYVLKLDGNYCLAEVCVNGRKANKSYFSDLCDVSQYLESGENTIDIKLYSGNRNLLGPHHLKDDRNPKWVGVDTYELVGSWDNGVSNKECDEYSFVRFGLFDKQRSE